MKRLQAVQIEGFDPFETVILRGASLMQALACVAHFVTEAMGYIPEDVAEWLTNLESTSPFPQISPKLHDGNQGLSFRIDIIESEL